METVYKTIGTPCKAGCTLGLRANFEVLTKSVIKPSDVIK